MIGSVAKLNSKLIETMAVVPLPCCQCSVVNAISILKSLPLPYHTSYIVYRKNAVDFFLEIFYLAEVQSTHV